MDDPDVPIASVKRSYQLVDEVRQRGRAGVTELSAALDLPKSTVHNHLRTLERLGYLGKEGGQYRLGVAYLGLGRAAREGRALYAHGRTAARSLGDRANVHTQLVVEENGMGAILFATSRDTEAGPARTRYPTHVHLHTNAPGKAILAQFSSERVDSILDRHGLPPRTDRTVRDATELREEIELVRQRGYAVDWGELIEGMVGVAAPVVTGETVHGAVAAYGPASEVQSSVRDDDLPSLVVEQAETVRADIVFSGGE